MIPVTVRPRAFGLALWFASAVVACNAISGADSYSEAQRCTGPLCGTCAEGHAPCGDVCCASGERCGDTATRACVPSCGTELFECGLTCCGRSDHCIDLGVGKGKRCSACERAEGECGASCCVSGETCIDRVLGVCSGTWASAKSGQSCGTPLDCGGTSCCAAMEVPGGEFPMGRSLTGTDYQSASALDSELPEHTVTVSKFSLDKFEVTVGRFRQFVERWDYVAPPAGAAANPRVPGSGWRTSWNDQLATSRGDLEARTMSCRLGTRYTLTPGANERMPLNCVTWFHAFAFCAWDGGRLPTEAEWEFAAANGARNDRYPWGAAPDIGRAAYGCIAPCTVDDIKAVGSFPKGANVWGHLDLGGNMKEWTLDLFDGYDGIARKDPGVVGPNGGVRTFRGGDYSSPGQDLRAARRDGDAAGIGFGNVGIRCARAAP